MIASLVAFAIALLLTLVVMPQAKRLAQKAGLVDRPDKKRKLHTSAIPLVGGVTAFVTGTLAVMVAIPLSVNFGETNGFKTEDVIQLWGLFGAATFLLLVGLIDDRFGMRGRQKLVGQIIAATVLIALGYSFDLIEFFGFKLNLGHFALIVMYGWILGGINSVNLLDGADGFATSLGILMSGGLCVMSLFNGYRLGVDGYIFDGIIAAAMCGALMGFLRFNFPPASAYLGDSGSMLIGMMVAALAIRSASKQQTAYAFFAPLALLAIPMFDTMAAIIRRRLTGKSIYSTDRGHIHHQLMRRGLSPRLALIWFATLCMTTVVGATLSLVCRQSEYAIVSILAVMIFLIAGRVFGFAEFKLVSDKAMSIGKSFLVLGKNKQNSESRQTYVQLQGDRNWNVVWQSVREFSEKHQLDEVTMDLDLPWLHESFHATYRSQAEYNESSQWYSEIPVQLGERLVGRLVVKADVDRCSVYHVLPLLMESMESLQSNLQLAIDRQSDLNLEAAQADGAGIVSPDSQADPSEPSMVDAVS